MYVDTHGHVNFNAYKDDGDEVVKRAFDAGVAIIAPSSQIDTSRRAIEYAERFNDSRLWAAVGLHPIHLERTRVDEAEVGLPAASPARVQRAGGRNAAQAGDQPKFETRYEEFDRARYDELLKSKYVVAVGEIGLDYWRKPKSKIKREEYKRVQIDTFVAQLDMATDHNLPVIIHCRVAHDDLLKIVESHRITREVNPPGVIHSYTGNKEQLLAFLKLGYYIGVNGLIFKLDFLEDIVRETPLDRILLETDAPYLTPDGAPSERNEPAYVKYTAERIAKLKDVPVGEIEKHTTENAQKVFKVDFKA